MPEGSELDRPADASPRNPWRRRCARLLASILAVSSVTVAADHHTGGGAAGPKPAPSASPALPLGPSGEAMPRGDLTGWRQVFADDFDNDVALGGFPVAVRGKWGAYEDGWPDTSKRGTYSPTKVVSIGNGLMDLHLRTDQGVHMVAAPMPVIHGPGAQGGMLYGRYAVRFRADPIPGYKVAWLLWPDSENWSDGEIDFPEGDLDQTVTAFMHHKGKPTNQDAFPTEVSFVDWHTSVMEWTPTAVRFLLDGALIGESTDRKLIPDVPMHWVLQTETALGQRVPDPAAAGHVQIDWVTAYSMEVPPNI